MFEEEIFESDEEIPSPVEGTSTEEAGEAGDDATAAATADAMAEVLAAPVDEPEISDEEPETGRIAWSRAPRRIFPARTDV